MSLSTLNLKLQRKQTIAFQSSATEILYGGAAGGGKSYLMRVAAIIWCSLIPGLQVYVFRRLFTDLWKNHMEGPSGFPALLAPWVAAKLVKINFSDNSIEFWNKSKIFLCHCQYEKDVLKYQGAEIHVLLVDELTHFTDKIYRFLRGRVRLAGLTIPPQFKGMFPRIICGSNPGAIGHNWVKFAFIDNAKEYEIRRMPKTEGGMLRQFIPARLEDNPALVKSDPDYDERLEGLGDPELVRAMREGDWDIVAGGMFDDLWKRHKHVIEPFEIPSSWTIDRSFDWGSSAPFSVGWWAESDGTKAPNGRTYPRGTLFRIYEWYGWSGKPNVGCKMLAVEIARGILEREQEWGIKAKPGPADSSIFDTDNGVCIADDMADAGVRWTEADKSPGSRKNGAERLRKFLKAALQWPMESPGLFVFDRCTHFIRTVPVLPRDERHRDDVDTDAEDHVYDETRYKVLERAPRKPVFSSAPVESVPSGEGLAGLL